MTEISGDISTLSPPGEYLLFCNFFYSLPHSASSGSIHRVTSSGNFWAKWSGVTHKNLSLPYVAIATPPRSDAWDDAGERHNQGQHLGQIFPEISGAGEERTAGAGRGGGERRAVHGVASPATPLQGYLHESARSCAGAPGKGRLVFVDGEGVPSPAPSPDDFPHGPVHGMTPVKNRIGAGSWAGLFRDIICTAPAHRGEGERRAVHG